MANHISENYEEPSKNLRSEKTAPVVNYIALLLIAAFLLLFMTYLMEQRQSAEILDGLRTSVSAMQSVENLYDENNFLLDENNKLQQDLFIEEQLVGNLQDQITSLTKDLETANTSWQAMDLFWQVNEAYVLGKYTLAKELMTKMEASDLDLYLPLENVSETGRYSPKLRYEEIREKLNFSISEDDAD